MLLPSPLRPAERSILFSGKSVRLSDDARSAASSHATKKGCSLLEVWRSQTCTSGSPFFCLLFFGEAKKSKCPAGMKRMVKIAPKANHNAQTLFRLPTPFPTPIGSLKTPTQTKKQTTQSELSALCDLVNLVKRDYAPWILAACLPFGPVVTSKETF